MRLELVRSLGSCSVEQDKRFVQCSLTSSDRTACFVSVERRFQRQVGAASAETPDRRKVSVPRNVDEPVVSDHLEFPVELWSLYPQE